MSKSRRSPAEASALRAAVHRFIRAFGLLASDQTPCGHPLHLSEAHTLLELLARSENELPSPTQRELGEHLHIDKSNVSRLCRRLEAAGLIKCSPSKQDRRSKCITLTAKGKRVATAVDTSSQARFSSLSAQLQNDHKKVIESLDDLAMALAAIADEDC